VACGVSETWPARGARGGREETHERRGCAKVDAIRITSVDNELVIVAFDLNGLTSRPLFHYVSGFTCPLDPTNGVVVKLDHVLTGGQNYWISFIGINWGGPYDYQCDFLLKGAKVANVGFNQKESDASTEAIYGVQGVTI
jgi:hypothetical protein